MLINFVYQWLFEAKKFMRHQQKNSNLFFLFFLSVVEMFALSVIFSTFASLFFEQHGLFTVNLTHAERVELLGVAMAMAPLAQFFSSGILGQLSDRFGRKPLLLVTISGTWFGALLLIIAITQHQFYLLLAAQFISGLFSGNLAIAQAAIADMLRNKSKTSGFNYLEIGQGVGMLLGPWIGGWLLTLQHQKFAMVLPYYSSLIMLSLALLGCIFYFRDTLTEDHRLQEKIDWTYHHGIKLLIHACSAKGVRTLLLCWAIFMLGWTFYLKFFSNFLHDVMGLNPTQISQMYAYMGVVYFVWQFGIIWPLVKRITARKWVAPMICCVGIFMLIMGFAQTMLLLCIAMAGYMLCMSLFMPTFHTWLSNRADEHEQGSIFGVSVAIHAFVNMLSGILGGVLVAWWPRSPLIGAGCLILFSFFLLIAIAPAVKTRQNS